MVSAKWHLFCLGLNELKDTPYLNPIGELLSVFCEDFR